MGTGGPPALVGPGGMTKPGDELAIGQPSGGLTGYATRAGRVPVRLADLVLEAIPDRARPEDDQLVIRGHPTGDQFHEPRQVLQAALLTGVLGRPAAMPDRRVVADMPRRPMMGWHVRVVSLQPYRTRLPAGDDGFAGVDPNEGAVLGGVVSRLQDVFTGVVHDCAHTGRSPRSAARSA